jgi:hypothetical protein
MATIGSTRMARGLAYRPGRLSLMEHPCQVHPVHYIHRGPFAARIWEERDPVTQELIQFTKRSADDRKHLGSI